MAAHGGRLELEPTERGTCFLITLPVERPSAGLIRQAGTYPGTHRPDEPRTVGDTETRHTGVTARD